MTDIRRALLVPGVMDNVMQLMGSPLGFQTDRDKGVDSKGIKVEKYTKEEIVDALVDAVCMGLKPVGNEFNIISKKCYPAKNGFTNRLRKVPGLWYKDTYGIPVAVDGGATVHVWLEWTLNKKKSTQELDFAIRVNTGMGADAIKGKAERKTRAWLFNHLTNSNLPDGDISDLVPLERQITGGKPETAAPDPLPQDKPDTASAADAMVYLTIKQALAADIGSVFNVRGYLVEMVPQKRGGKDVTLYTITSPDDPQQITIEYWDKPKPGAAPDGECKMAFAGVKPKTYQGNIQRPAKDIKVGW
jgi:hypothetical protein